MAPGQADAAAASRAGSTSDSATTLAPRTRASAGRCSETPARPQPTRPIRTSRDTRASHLARDRRPGEAGQIGDLPETQERRDRCHPSRRHAGEGEPQPVADVEMEARLRQQVAAAPRGPPTAELLGA